MIHKARLFATHHHAFINHRRRYTGEPYIVHPAAVVELVRSVPHTEAMIAAAWLHDVVEDTRATHNDVLVAFGSEVADLVRELTNISTPVDGNRAARKAKDRAHMSQASAAAQTIKLADRLDNLRSIRQHDPRFYATYKAETRELLTVLGRGDRWLRDLLIEELAR